MTEHKHDKRKANSYMVSIQGLAITIWCDSMMHSYNDKDTIYFVSKKVLIGRFELTDYHLKFDRSWIDYSGAKVIAFDLIERR